MKTTYALTLAVVFGVLSYFTSFIVTVLGFLAALLAVVFMHLHRKR
ncbi:hypothetical protein [Pontibacter mangrovi]|nr:hypothetical protein [Pontibacter mangrovi]